MNHQDTATPDKNNATVDALNAALQDSISRYRERTPNSKKAITEASKVMPGGLTRGVLQYDPYPIVAEHTEGGRIRCVDGHEYLDYVGDYSAGLYGHSHPTMMAAIQDALTGGLSYGAPHRHERELAELLVKRFPSFEKVQFTNSGTEANLGAIKTARAFTGRDAILVFEGGYHGGVMGFNYGPSPDNAPYDFIVGHYNDLEATLEVLGNRGPELAAIIVEPLIWAGGGLPAVPGFLEGLQQLAKEHGALLIFDEVMTSRHGPSGLQGLLGITPDLTSMGKYIGGGFAFGCFGGRADVMDIYAPDNPNARHPVNSGTFNNNVITSKVALVGLRDVYTPEAATEFLQRGNAFRDRLDAICKEQGVKAQMSGTGTVLGIHFCDNPIRTPNDIKGVRDEARALLYFEMLARGFYMVRRGGITLSLSLTDDDNAAFCDAFTDVLATYGGLLSV